MGVFSLVIGIIGILVNAILIHMRFEMVFYARTINLVRCYFAEHGEGPDIQKYLGLPTTDAYPHFDESPASKEWWARYTGTFFEILFVGLISAVLFFVAFSSLLGPVLPQEYQVWGLVLYALIAGASMYVQLRWYHKWATAKETAWSEMGQQQAAPVSKS